MVYIAGPLFSWEQRELLERIAKICESLGFSTYLPHRDAGLFKRDEEKSSVFFRKDAEQLEKCSIIIAVLNGTDVDSGTSWEIGYGFAKGKTIIGYLDDTRVYDAEKQVNPMIFNSAGVIVKGLDELEKSLKSSR